MKFNVWRTSQRIEKEYLKTLNVLCDLFSKIAKSSGNDYDKYRRKMNNFQNSIQYKKYITSAVKRMVVPLSVNNEKTWRKAAKKSMAGNLFYKLLIDEIEKNHKKTIEAQIEQNISLIKTLPSDVATKVVNDIAENALKGKRAESIEKIIRSKTDQHARASARLIARTEVAKTQAALTEARSKDIGINWYVWRTALDGDRVRKSHRNMEGVLVNWNNPPSPEELVGEKNVGRYHAGNIWNCRCYAEPLLEIDDVRWPHKVYINDQIVMMNKNKFEEIL